MPKITLPKWVYKTLADYGNVALPNECNEMDKTELAKHLEKEVGFAVSIRECQFLHKDDYVFGTMNKRIQKVSIYYVAEIKR